MRRACLFPPCKSAWFPTLAVIVFLAFPEGPNARTNADADGVEPEPGSRFSITSPTGTRPARASAPADDGSDAAWDSEEDPAVRLIFMPLIGTVGGMPGMGGEFGMGYKAVAWGVRASGGTEFCIFCGDPEKESQISFLLGVRHEFEIGVLSLKSGMTKLERTTRGDRIESGGGMGIWSTTEYEMLDYEGLGVPIQFDLILGGRFVGVGFSLSFLQDGLGGSSSVLIGIPFGYLRR